jgi:hypothetical protein
MSIWDFWNVRAQDYVHGMLDEAQSAADTNYSPLEADAQYVLVLLRRMRIVNVRKGFKKFYGTVHTDIGTQHASGKAVTFAQVIAPPELRDVEAKDLDRTIVSNQPLFGLTPYRGGPLQLNAALLSVQSADFLGPFLDVLTDLASLAGVSYVAAARPFLDPMRRAIDLLTGTTGSQILETYLVTNLTNPSSGIYVVMRAPKTEINLRDLRVESDYSLSHAKGVDLARYPYLVLSIEGRRDRPDWRGIPEIGRAYDELTNALRADSPPAVENAMVVFARTARLSDDLLSDHAENLIAQVETMKNRVLGAPRTGPSEAAVSVPALESFDPFVSRGS